MFNWLYIHMSLGRNGGFLFGFTTAVTLIFVLVGFPIVSWCKECLKDSESSRRIRQAGRSKRKHAQGIKKRGEAPFSGVVQFTCLFRLLLRSQRVQVGWQSGSLCCQLITGSERRVCLMCSCGSAWCVSA